MAEGDLDDWLTELRARADGLTPPTDLTLRIELRLDGVPAWHIAFAEGRARVDDGGAPDADVTVTTSRRVAAAIAAGAQSAQRAFLDGELRIGGDVQALLDNRAALAAVGAMIRAD